MKPGSRLVILLNHPLPTLTLSTQLPPVSSSPYHAHPSQESCCAICSSDFFTGTILPGFLSTPSHLQICRTLIQVFSPHPLFAPILRGKHLCPASEFSYFVFYDEDKTPHSSPVSCSDSLALGKLTHLHFLAVAPIFLLETFLKVPIYFHAWF